MPYEDVTCHICDVSHHRVTVKSLIELVNTKIIEYFLVGNNLINTILQRVIHIRA